MADMCKPLNKREGERNGDLEKGRRTKAIKGVLGGGENGGKKRERWRE